MPGGECWLGLLRGQGGRGGEGFRAGGEMRKQTLGRKQNFRACLQKEISEASSAENRESSELLVCMIFS